MKAWQRLSPKARRYVVIVAGVAVLLLLVSLLVPERRPATSPIRAAEPVQRVLAEVDERDLNLETLLQSVGELRQTLEDSRRDIDAVRGENEALRRQLATLADRETASPPPAPRPLPSPPAASAPDDAADGAAPSSIDPRPREVEAPVPAVPRPPAAASRLPTRTLDEIFAGPPPDRVPAAPAVDRLHRNGLATADGAGRPPAAAAGPIRTISTPPPDPDTAPTTAGEFFLPAGSVLTGHLVTGYVAGTTEFARTNPFPALVRLDDISILPNRFRANMVDCHILISGYGDLSSERVLARAETLACIDRDGEVLEQPLEAYVSGADGLAGLGGRLVRRDGQVIAQALLVGFAQATAEAFGGGDTVSLGVNPRTGAFEGQQPAVGSAFLSGAGGALDRLAQYYISTAEKILPVLEVAAGTEVGLIVTRGGNLRLKDAQE